MFWLPQVATCFGEDLDLVIGVSVDSANAPDAVILEKGVALTELKRRADEPLFESAVSIVSSDSSLREDFRLIAKWSTSDSEQLFLGLGPMTNDPSIIPMFIFRVPSDMNGVRKLDNLGTDTRSVLCKYFGGREICRSLREKGLPHVTAALRSARIWFDAAVQLTIKCRSIGV
jgi:hypothetical protein